MKTIFGRKECSMKLGAETTKNKTQTVFYLNYKAESAIETKINGTQPMRRHRTFIVCSTYPIPPSSYSQKSVNQPSAIFSLFTFNP